MSVHPSTNPVNKTEAQIEQELLKDVNFNLKFKIWMGFLSVALIICLYFYYLQLRDGLGVTGMHDFVTWGIYISNFVFFVAVSLIGMLISSVLGLAGVKWAKPISRLAEVITVAFAMVAGLIIITDMGRPDRLHHVFLYGRVQSPIVWDIAVVITYVTISVLLFYLPLIPDLKLALSKLPNLGKFHQRVYKALSLKWTGGDKQVKLLKKFIKLLLILVVPVALAIHTVTSWLFAMTLRSGWDTSIFGPYFVAGAFVAGCAIMIIAMFFFRKIYKLHHYITDNHFNMMGKLLVLVSMVYVYFNINEILVPAYKLKASEVDHLGSILSGHDAIMFWLVQMVGLLLPFSLLLIKKLRKPLPITIVSVILLVGAWFKRYLIVIPVQLHPYLPIQNVPDKYHGYSPTMAELAITAAPFILALMIITVLTKLFPVIPIWEVKENMNNND